VSVTTAAVDDVADRERWALGGVVPARIVRPADAGEVAAVVADVAAEGGTLVPLGRGAHRALGHPPARYDVALVDDRLAAVRDYTPADMTVTVEAGVTLAELATLLAREGQWLPLDPALPAETTVGGLVAADLAGPLAATQGRVRDYVIGIAVVTASGVPARAGGRVVKNVAGYDLMKLFVGSLGTLAVLTEATFKVRPRPEAERCVVLATHASSNAVALGAALAAAHLELLSVTVVGGVGASNDPTLVVRLGGTSADVAVSRTRLLELAARHAAAPALDVDEPASAAQFDAVRDFSAHAAGDLLVRFAVLPSRLPTLVADACRVEDVELGSWHADPLRGVLRVALVTGHPEAVLATLARIADAHGAHLVVERWPVALAATVEVWRPLPAALPLMRRMKDALDPAGTFATGRFVGRL
jgi:glycolate dehydrogenase FAD-binding subunit